MIQTSSTGEGCNYLITESVSAGSQGADSCYAPLSSRSYESYSTTPTFISSRDCMSYAGTVNTTPRASCLIVWAALDFFLPSSSTPPTPHPHAGLPDSVFEDPLDNLNSKLGTFLFCKGPVLNVPLIKWLTAKKNNIFIVIIVIDDLMLNSGLHN